MLSHTFSSLQNPYPKREALGSVIKNSVAIHSVTCGREKNWGPSKKCFQ